MFIVVTNRADGSIYGPFDTLTAAENYAHSHCVGCCWHVAMLTK